MATSEALSTTSSWTLAGVRNSKHVIVFLVYVTLLLDNILLTVVVPIIPDYLYHSDNPQILSDFVINSSVSSTLSDKPVTAAPADKGTAGSLVLIKSGHFHAMLPGNCSANTAKFDIYSVLPQEKLFAKKSVINITHAEVVDENSRVGALLSSKALVQLAVNPLVGIITGHLGYHLPLFFGTVSLLLAALAFAFAENFVSLLLARSLQGLASACIGVSGMCLVADLYPDDASRSKVMGLVLGSIALGVLLGYPFGGLLYDFVGKMAPFLIIATLIFIVGAMQVICLTLKPIRKQGLSSTSWPKLLTDGFIILTAGAIWISTSAMAILEPLLPIWLMRTVKPQKWQLGTVFIPDSLGYLLGTNCFGLVAYRLGHWRVAIAAMMLVGLSVVLIPSASDVAQLTLPHFGTGLGIGIVDAALVPLLASLVDTRHAAHYGSVYTLQQTAVSLAYALGPLVGGELVQAIGFPWLMRIVGLLNILYCPLLLLLISRQVCDDTLHKDKILLKATPAVNYRTNSYERFFDDSD
ncbi:synaptic vesicular amine transporter [Anabrus simplex]|uniref:synaptic vesicular amine transporter n=1 Tax=Anabrus simplex TaxID=316456 RepID=UPI0035A3AA72